MPADLAWTAHPAARKPHHAALLVAVCLFSAYAVLVASRSLLLCALAVVILLASTSRFWLRTHYVMDALGIAERHAGRHRYRAWDGLRRLEIGPSAALLSPFAAPNLLERARGMVVYFDGGSREEIINRLRQHLAKETATNG